MATSVCHQQPVDAITEDAIDEGVNSSGTVMNVKACAAVMALLGKSTVTPTPVVPKNHAVWWRVSSAAIPTHMAPAQPLVTLTTLPLMARPMTSREPAAMF